MGQNKEKPFKLRSVRRNPVVDYYLKSGTKDESWSDEHSEATLVVLPAGEEIEERYRALLRLVETSQT